VVKSHPDQFIPQERDLVPIVRSLKVDKKHKRNRINHKKEYEQFLYIHTMRTNNKHDFVMVKLLSLSLINL